MIGFQEFLINNGFKSFRKIYKNKEWILVSHKECGIKDNEFTSMVHGGLYIYYIKDNLQVEWGLGDQDKPPTLLYPYPLTNLSKCQDTNERVLKNFSNEDVFDSLFNGKILTL